MISEYEQIKQLEHLKELDNVGVSHYGNKIKNPPVKQSKRLSTPERIKNGHKRRGIK